MFFAAFLVMLLSHNVVMCATIPLGNQPLAAATKIAGEDDCSMPSKEELVRIFAESGDFFAYIVGSEEDLGTEEEGSKTTNSTAKAGPESDLQCPVGKRVDRSSPLRLRSVCPWELFDEYDSNRFPKKIQKAVCMCTNCIDPSTNKLDTNQSCGPIYYPMPVLRRTGCTDGIATFEPRYEQVPVACECKLRKRNHNSESNDGIPAMKM